MDGGELDEVLAFLAAFDAGSFTTASTILGRDASIVSSRVGALESRFGVRLMGRTTHRLAPTEAGTAFYRRMRAALSMMDEASTEIAQSSHIASGLLRIRVARYSRSALGRPDAADLEKDFRYVLEAAGSADADCGATGVPGGDRARLWFGQDDRCGASVRKAVAGITDACRRMEF
ncbi:LysR family transcriptional regulator [Paraburkholderia silvatlantica]|uniref:LysR family transcriptional regulator n=1 Tax=Paraburkholderia silvatlantica TaxID=321895 RepID=UPI000DA1A892|nr:LysR family transcriptional regulator [Paraburkholderia silvatlantica]